MYTGVSLAVNTLTTSENDNSTDIPEWKKLLIMKKRAGNSPNVDECAGPNLDSSAGGMNIANNGECSSACDIFSTIGNKYGRSTKVIEEEFYEKPPRTVTIGNINIELRSVKTVPESEELYPDQVPNSDLGGEEYDNDEYEDLQYGPGIVDRLRARFLNIGAERQRKPVVRRFSSLENLPVSNVGPYRVNTRGLRQNGFKTGAYNFIQGTNVKKAQSMETLLCSTPEQQIMSSSKRPSARYIDGVKARIFSKNISTMSLLTSECLEHKETSSPASSPRLINKSLRKWDYNRSISAPNINEDELPKPDTVKHVKKIFESPPIDNSSISEKPLCHSSGSRYRKIPGNITPTSTCNNSAISENSRSATKKLDVSNCCIGFKTSAKEPSHLIVNCPSKQKELSPAGNVEKCNDYKIKKTGYSRVPRMSDARIAQDKLSFESFDQLIPSTESSDISKEGVSSVLSQLAVRVTAEHLSSPQSNKYSEALSQSSEFNQVERLKDDLHPHPQADDVDKLENEMVIAADASERDSVSESFFTAKKDIALQRAPQVSTSIVFDFRGKDVKPNISLKPAPFGCRQAKVTRSSNSLKKRSSSPPRTDINSFFIKDCMLDDDEDWEGMDIGADLPAKCGIVFMGENVKVGRGALLETRNKKLTIQFDDKATSTFEYPSENASLSPNSETCSSTDFAPKSAISIDSPANSRLGLCNYIPHILSSSEEFELGISQQNHKSPSFLPERSDLINDVSVMDVIVPANPDGIGSWSANETADILF